LHTDGHDRDHADLLALGYEPKLKRTIGAYTSFALGFSMVTITTTIFTLFTDPFQKLGGVGIWLWVLVTAALFLITLVYGHLAARLPVTGYAFQWSSRLVSPHYGWFTGWTALVSFFAGTASIAVALATVFASEFWDTPTTGNIEILASIAIIVAVLINIVGIKAATWFNNVGASTELVGTLGLALVMLIGLFFFKNSEGPSVLFQSGPVDGSTITLTSVGLALLLPVYTLLGWEGSADLAEETKDPRRTAPRAMLRSVAISGIAGFIVYAIFSMAIPHGIGDTVGQTGNPLVYVFQEQLGSGVASLLKVIVFISIFAALLANVTVATRMCFSLSRDKMLPGSRVLSWVSPKTSTPIASILCVGLFAILVNVVSAGLITRVAAIVAVTYYGTYLLTLLAALWADAKGRMPDAPPGYFGLGRWLRPAAIGGALWSIVVILFMTVPTVNHTAGQYTLVAEAIGIVWYFAYVRRGLQRREIGPPSAILAPDAAPAGGAHLDPRAAPQEAG
jgi:amino acid transporter